MALPEKLKIRWMPDLHTSYVGRFNGSDQFFLAHHVVPHGEANCEYLALYCFDSRGALIRDKIVGPVDHVPDEEISRLLASLGSYQFTDICVSPFQVPFDGRIFGLIADSGHHAVTLEPGAMITFMEPWDGEYYT